jgi:hypothetical protein
LSIGIAIIIKVGWRSLQTTPLRTITNSSKGKMIKGLRGKGLENKNRILLNTSQPYYYASFMIHDKLLQKPAKNRLQLLKTTSRWDMFLHPNYQAVSSELLKAMSNA